LIASLTLTSIAPMAMKLLTPDYFIKNTCLFKDNFLHEMPFDVQIAIMGKVGELDKQELERKQDLEEQINSDIETGIGEAEDIVARAISNILWELKVRIGDDDDDDKYIELLNDIIDQECEVEDWSDPKIDNIQCVVNWAGVMYYLQELTREYGVNINDYTSEELYAKCYHCFLYNRITEDYSCEDIKLIQKFNINVLINDE
jgi:hypothetical protein